MVTETTITTTTTTIIEEKYRVQAPETMQETFMSDSEDEGGEDGVLGDHSYRYLTVDEMKSLGDDSMPMDGMGDERRNSGGKIRITFFFTRARMCFDWKGSCEIETQPFDLD